MTIVVIALGGALGAVARYGVSWLIGHLLWTPLSLGTLTVNVIGSLVFGYVMAGVAKGAFTEEQAMWCLIGFLGAFTTFSTYSYQAFVFLSEGRYFWAGAQVVLHNVCSIVAVGIGMKLWGVFKLLS